MVTNNKQNSCPIRACNVRFMETNLVYASGETAFIKTAPRTGVANTFDLLIKTDYNPKVKAGWDMDKLTIRCTNGLQYLETDPFKVTVAANPCRDVLSKDQSKIPADLLGVRAIPYDSDSVKTWTDTIYDFSAGFANS